MIVTIYDVAQEAGVSTATVSRVINHHPNVRDSVREKVNEVIVATGYVPNEHARQIRLSKIKWSAIEGMEVKDTV